MAIQSSFARLSLQAKLFTAFALLFVLVLGGGGLAWYSSHTIKSQQDLTTAAARRLQVAEQISGINAEIFGAEKNMILGGLTGDSLLLERWTARLEELIAGLGLQARLDQQAAGLCPPARSRFHAAPYDALAGALLLLELGRDPAFAELSVRQLLAYSTLDPDKRQAITQTELF